jgi:hypothetical protein
MSNHKYRNTKNQRAGCLMCKPNKMNGANPNLGHVGFGNVRKEVHSKRDMQDALDHPDNT